MFWLQDFRRRPNHINQIFSLQRFDILECRRFYYQEYKSELISRIDFLWEHFNFLYEEEIKKSEDFFDETDSIHLPFKPLKIKTPVAEQSVFLRFTTYSKQNKIKQSQLLKSSTLKIIVEQSEDEKPLRKLERTEMQNYLHFEYLKDMHAMDLKQLTTNLVIMPFDLNNPKNISIFNLSSKYVKCPKSIDRYFNVFGYLARMQ